MNILNHTLKKPNKFVYSMSYKIIGLLYIVLLSYNFHRYVFMYNSVKTSPTYQDTPVIWKIGKYIIVVLIALLLYFNSKFYNIKNKLSVFLVGLFIFWSFIVTLFYYANFGTASMDELEYLIWGILFFPVFFMKEEHKISFINFLPNHFKPVSIITIATGLFVIANYYITGRLTALSYEGGLSRYGGLWDDPNGFGLFCCFLIYIALNKKKWATVFFLLVCIVFTVSFSAYLVLIAVGFFWGIKNGRVNRSFAFITALGLFLVIIFGIIYKDQIVNFVALTFEQKKGSIEEHANTSMEFVLFPFFKRIFIFHETWYISYFYNYAPLSLIYTVIVITFLFHLMLKKVKNYAEMYMIVFLLGCLFIPFFTVFPLNVIFILYLYSYTTIKTISSRKLLK